MSRITTRATSAVVALVVGLAMSLAMSSASTASTGSKAGSATTTTSSRLVVHNGVGSLRSRIVGTTSKGQRVTGTFVPLHVVKRHGQVKVRGLVQGVVHHANGSTSSFAAMRSIRLQSVNGTPASAGRLAAAAAPSCAILHLVLGPLDLNLLGLTVHLDRVVLNIDAVPGAGNLLGNLLCSVAGLLDGGLGGQLGTLTSLLNRILGLLNLSL
ncbi:hypothetical protein GCM10009798_14870 [Nocardioides panacihumi]|uniref:ABC transporter substrate-binding protein n=1 Tax=Nocardioides panacihumi TaxID=400774 RepID=A0ABN2QQW6_9ACTN